MSIIPGCRPARALITSVLLVSCGTSGPIDPVDPVPSTVAVTPGTSTLTSLGASVPLTATVTDEDGNPIAGAPVQWGSDASSVATVSGSGVVTAVADGVATITAAVGGVSGQATVTVTQSPAAVAFVTGPSDVAVGGTMSPVSVQIVDARGNRVASATTAVTVGLDANPGSATLSGTVTAAAVVGVASFADLIIDAAGSGYTLAASATGLAAVVSTAFDVTALHVPGTVSWNDPAGGPWTDGSRWSGGVTPGPGDTVLISLPGTFTVVANTSIEVALLVVGGGAGAQTLQIGSSALTATDSVHVAPTGRLEVVGSTSLGAAPLTVEGTLDLVAGALTVAGGFAMTDGSVLRGNGTLDLSSASAGAFDADVRPGASPGILTVVGDLTLSSASTLTLELDGTTAGTAHDRLDVSGTLTLGGTLEVVVGAGYTPSPADTLVVLTYAAIVGAFADTTGLTPSGMTFATGTSSAQVRGPAPMPATWTAVSVGASHSCGLVSGGVAYCWGRNALSQLGTNSQIDLWAPTKVVTPVRFQSLAAGVHNTCGVALDGIGWCWGLSAQTGTGSSAGSAQPVPVQISGGHTFQRIEHGSGQTACGLTTAGELYCWGENAFGQVGDGTTDHHPSPTLVALPGPVLSFTVGGTHACAVLVSSAGYCWGDGSLGQLGEATPASLTPLASSAAANAVALSSGGNVTCALRANQTVECWGSGLFNGTASNASTHVPASIENVGNVISIAQHSGASCVVATDAKGHCWGDNFANALGLGAGFVGQGLVAVPQPMTGGLDFAAVSTGNYHGCGLTTDGGMYCWGDNQFGQLGVHLANDDLHTPIEVTPPS